MSDVPSYKLARLVSSAPYLHFSSSKCSQQEMMAEVEKMIRYVPERCWLIDAFDSFFDNPTTWKPLTLSMKLSIKN